MRLLRFRSLSARLACATVLVVSTVMAGLIFMVERHQRTAIIEETERRGEVLARNLAAMSLDDKAANVMLLKQFGDIEQRLVCRSGDNFPTLHFQNCRDVHLVSSSLSNFRRSSATTLAPQLTT